MNESTIFSATASWLLATTLVTTLLAASLLLLGSLLNRPRLWHVLWAAVLIKFLVPFGIPVLDTSLSIHPTTSGAALASTTGPTTFELTGETTQTSRIASEPRAIGTATGISNKETSIDTSDASPSWPWEVPVGTAILLVWLSVSVLLIARTANRIAIFHRRLRDADVDASLEDRLTRVARVVDCPTLPRVRLIPASIPPLLWAWGRRPTIVLPKHWWSQLTESEGDIVLAHELLHWKRRDHWVCWLRTVTKHVFWWHPIIWIADRRLDALAEQCCDGEVVHYFESHRRAHALTLLSIADWLSGDPVDPYPPSLATPMASTSGFTSLHRRIKIMSESTCPPWTRFHRVFASMACVLLIATSVGFAQVDEKPAPSEDASDPPSSALTGRITDVDGNPIGGAVVRCVIPPVDLRFPLNQKKHRIIEATSDRSGSYGMLIDGLTEDTSAAIDVQVRGYRRLVGTMMAGGDPNKVTVKPAEKTTFDAKLPPSLYFAGRVVDQKGEPISGVLVASELSFGRGMANVERTRTDNEGRFQIHGYEQRLLDGMAANALVRFQHPDHINTRVENLQNLDEDERETISVTMTRGLTYSGQIVGSDGQPRPDVLVAMQSADSGNRRTDRTDANGTFRLTGIMPGELRLRVVHVPTREKLITAKSIEMDIEDEVLQLQPIDEPLESSTEVLGMKLINVTKEIVDAYDLRQSSGVMVVDPGENFKRLKIGNLSAGNVFWMVGEKRISNIKEMLGEVVQTAQRLEPDGSANSQAGLYLQNQMAIRVVYNYQAIGSNTQYMRLTPEDVDAIQAVLKGLE